MGRQRYRKAKRVHHVQPHKQAETPKPDRQEGWRGFYHANYKPLLLIPLLMLLLAFAQIGVQLATTGDFLNRGVSLKGGITVTIPVEDEFPGLAAELRSALPGRDINVRTTRAAGEQTSIMVESSETEAEELLAAIEAATGIPRETYSVDIMGSSLGASFFKEVMAALAVAFLFMGIVVFIYFRSPVPSLAVILAAFSNIVVTLAIVNILGIKLSTAGIAAFLMLIGYSIDTDILLTTRVLKRKEGTVQERILQAAKTGLTMNATSLAAIIIVLIFSRSEVITQITTILLIGLLVDLVNTWIQNVGILRYYLEKKHEV